MTNQAKPLPFSVELDNWIKHGKDKSLSGLVNLFAEKSFAIIFLILMALPALPLPTGGITHVAEVIVMLVSLQMIIGRKTVWLTKGWGKINAGKYLSGKAGSKLLSIIRWFEKWSKQRMAGQINNRMSISIIGLIVLLLTISAFVAPPFTGLDTLPSLGVVVIALGLILEDILPVLAGMLIGIVGVVLEIATASALYLSFSHFL